MPSICIGAGAFVGGNNFCIAVGDNARAFEGEVVILPLISPLPLTMEEREKVARRLATDSMVEVYGLRLIQMIVDRLMAATLVPSPGSPSGKQKENLLPPSETELSAESPTPAPAAQE